MAARRRGTERARRARSELYRGLVLEAAQRVFADKGYEDAKMEEIARESGLSLGTLYSVFAGKAEIFAAVHETGDREIQEHSEARASGASDPLAALLAGVRAYTEYFLEHPDFLRMHLKEGLTWGLAGSGAGSRRRTDAWLRGVEGLAAACRRCIDAGVFHPGDPQLQARMMIAMQQVQLAAWVEGGMQRDPAEVQAEIEAQVRRSFCKEG
jgi:AcrR family transcriptional regulator